MMIDPKAFREANERRKDLQVCTHPSHAVLNGPRGWVCTLCKQPLAEQDTVPKQQSPFQLFPSEAS